jgi:hypothetical protein
MTQSLRVKLVLVEAMQLLLPLLLQQVLEAMMVDFAIAVIPSETTIAMKTMRLA